MRCTCRQWPAAMASLQRAGMALLVVMVLLMLVALAAYRFSFYMESQYRLARLTEEQLQARLAALSGLEYAAYLLEQPHAQRSWQNSLNAEASSLAGVPLRTESSTDTASTELTAWRFSLLSPAAQTLSAEANASISSAAAGQPILHRFGLENESAKLSIPLLLRWERLRPGTARTALLRLPGANPALVDHWLRLQGVSTGSATQTSQTAPSTASSLSGAGQRLTATGELGFNDQLRWLWYGGDLNQNYQLDPLEIQLGNNILTDAAAPTALPDNSPSQPSLPSAWKHYLTWTSGERNVSATGQQRINLNQPDLSQLHRELLRSWPVEWANFVVALRQYGPASSRTTSTVAATAISLNLAAPPRYQLTSLLDVLDAQVTLAASASEKQTVHSPFSSDMAASGNYLARVLDEASLDARATIDQAIDVSAAPVEVLAAIPGLTEAQAQAIVQRRAAVDATRQATIAWLITEQLLTINELRNLLPYLIARSDVFSVQSLGFRDTRSPIARYTAIIDARHMPARCLQRQHWHDWDRGFDLATVGLTLEPEALR